MLRLSPALVVCFLAVVPAACGDEQRTSLRVASVSFVPEKWNKDGNIAIVEKMTRAAAADGAELVITPEGILEGYVINEVIREEDPAKRAELTRRFNEIAEPIDGPYIKRLRGLADELNIWLIAGFLEAEGEKFFNTAAILGPEGQVVGKYHKTHFHQGYDDNPPGYEPGNEYPVFDVAGIKLGIVICFDRQLPEPSRALALQGADMIVCPSYGGFGDWNTRLMQVRAYENQVYVVFSHPEQTLFLDRRGELLSEGAEGSYTIQDIDLTKREKTRESVIRRRPETYRKLGVE